MRSLLLLLATVIYFTPTLSADRVMITKTSKKSNLSHINKTLQKLHVKMYYKKNTYGYIVYSQNYSTKSKVNSVFKKIKAHFPSAYISSSDPLAVSSEKGVLQKPKNYGFFVDIGGGSSSFTGTDSQSGTLNVKGNNYFLDGGYYFNKYSYISVAYQNINSDGGSLNNLSTAINLNYPLLRDFNIYTGVLIGYSELSLDLEGATPSASLIGGVLVGLSYDLFSHVPLSISYQHIISDHTIDYSDTKQVNFSNINNINFGVGYKF